MTMTGRSRADDAPSPQPLLDRLAANVRARRKDRALTLRELAEHAGVSERFLVLLEAGRANVSVVKLDDIGRALGSSAAALLADEAAPQEGAGSRPLVALLGLRGSGKSAIGARAAARLGWPFVELDEAVEAHAGMGLAELFELHGADYYRRVQREEIDRLLSAGATGFLATGGGVVADHETFGRLRGAALTIWLKARPEDHYARVLAQGDTRPAANREDAMRELRALLRARRPLYERSDHVVDTSALGLERSVERVVRFAREACAKTRAPAP
jgi:XRE family aerobic/anaerobic benzoate catabolism transcriptional regulator